MPKRYVMECIGTFFLTITISLMGSNPAAVGFMLMAMVYVGGHVSGAQFNPAISFACLINNSLTFIETLLYIISQIIGACIGLFFFALVTGGSFMLDMIPGNALVLPMIIEGLFALVLCWVYLALNFDNHYRNSSIKGLIIGTTLLMLASIGGLFNPAVAIASIISNLFSSDTFFDSASVIVYTAGPLLGGLASSLLFNYFKPE